MLVSHSLELESNPLYCEMTDIKSKKALPFGKHRVSLIETILWLWTISQFVIFIID